ncbi:MAG: hypothetical protein M1270_08290 [Gammaproteobacteria bacterium]|nr:hypothetical protein [Gammaproteobacteria bacterium]
MPEENHDEWKELRSRVDSLGSAVFLVAGGALTLSVSVRVNAKSFIDASLKPQVEWSWYLLLASIICFVLLKVSLIAQAFMRHAMKPDAFNQVVCRTNIVGWSIGVIGLLTFMVGMCLMVRAAIGAVFT